MPTRIRAGDRAPSVAPTRRSTLQVAATAGGRRAGLSPPPGQRALATRLPTATGAARSEPKTAMSTRDTTATPISTPPPAGPNGITVDGSQSTHHPTRILLAEARPVIRRRQIGDPRPAGRLRTSGQRPPRHP